MGYWRDFFSGRANPIVEAALAPSPGPSFTIDETAIDPAVFGLTSYAAPTSPAPRIDRRAAIQVPAVKRSRDLIAGSLGSLPIDLYSPAREQVRSVLFEQPEVGVPRSVSMTRLIEDLLFEGVAWWQITEQGWHTYPVKVKRLDPRKVTVNEDTGRVYVNGKHVADSELIRFDSPNDGLLIAGARSIRTCLALDAAANRYADGAPPLDYFTPADGADPADDADVIEILNQWRDARQTRSTGYVPASLKYNIGGWNPEQLQLADARQHAVLEIARVAGVDPEELGVSTTSRTYANQFDRRKAFLDFTLGGYISAIQDRLSMPDVTPRGYYARVNLDAFLRSDTLTRYQSYAVGLQVGALTQDEVRQIEDKQPLKPSEHAQLPSTQKPQEEPVEASLKVQEIFATTEVTPMEASPSTVFEVDRETRTITGLAVPYGKPAMSRGRLYQFAKSTLRFGDVTRVKLLVQHDFAAAVGYATALEETEAGLVASFKVARGPEGDRALTLAEDKVLDGLSIGLGQGGKFRTTQAGVFHAVDAPLAEISLTPCPAFDDARVLSVAASADQGEIMDEQTIETVEVAPDFSAVTDAIKEGFQALQFPQRETVPAGGSLQVTEELPYRFDGIGGEHGFIDDLRAGFTQGDGAARQRLDAFLEEAFDVTSANVASLNPTQNRPELYVPQLQYNRPLWDLVSTGTVVDKTPFTVPKFSSASGLVAAHVEGTEPTEGVFTATSQTVSPAPVSGKVEITREVWDQGGSPQADSIIWGEMVGAYYEAIESRIAVKLAAVAGGETNLASAVDEALVDAVQGMLADLQYVRGGNRFTGLALDGMLFKALINASDTSGRKLLPVLAPQNAQGETSGGFDRVQLGGTTGRAAWALGATNASLSYLFVPSSVWAWASAPKKFTFEYRVSLIDMAIWGYGAEAVLRDSDVKKIDYTTADV